jgi:N-acetylmuramoyl-L-alanine amidase
VKPRPKLKARLLKEAIESNLDAIYDRLPLRLRPVQRRLDLVRAWTIRLALPVSLFVVVSAAGSLPAPSASQPASAERVPDAGVLAVGDRGSDDDPGASLVPHAFPPGVLALGVRRVVIDAGHGGDHPGTVSDDGLAEKNITIDIARRMARVVVAHGFEAVMTRHFNETLSLRERVDVANNRRGDIFVSIHVNAFASADALGIETYFVGPTAGSEHDALAERENQHADYALGDMRTLLEHVYADARREESRRLARAVQSALVHAARTENPDVVNRGVKMAPFVVLAATEMPAVLAEVSWLSHADEVNRLRTPQYRQLLAEALASGVVSFAHLRITDQKGQNTRGN